jgi:hypothetical protein
VGLHAQQHSKCEFDALLKPREDSLVLAFKRVESSRIVSLRVWVQALKMFLPLMTVAFWGGLLIAASITSQVRFLLPGVPNVDRSNRR